jgi:hypothetical protein
MHTYASSLPLATFKPAIAGYFLTGGNNGQKNLQILLKK